MKLFSRRCDNGAAVKPADQRMTWRPDDRMCTSQAYTRFGKLNGNLGYICKVPCQNSSSFQPETYSWDDRSPSWARLFHRKHSHQQNDEAHTVVNVLCCNVIMSLKHIAYLLADQQQQQVRRETADGWSFSKTVTSGGDDRDKRLNYEMDRLTSRISLDTNRRPVIP